MYKPHITSIMQLHQCNLLLRDIVSSLHWISIILCVLASSYGYLGVNPSLSTRVTSSVSRIGDGGVLENAEDLYIVCASRGLSLDFG